MVGRQRVLESLPAADVLEPEPDQRQEAGDDEEELEDFVVDGAGEPAEEDVAENDDGREDDARRGRSVTASGDDRRGRAAGVWISRAIAYIEMPEEKTVMKANEKAFKARVFSSKRSRRNSGTERALEP